MGKKVSEIQLQAWELLITRQSKLLKNIELELSQEKKALPLHWYDVLLVLKRSSAGKLRQSEIADKIVTSKSALSRSLDKLEERGLIKREQASEDGRGQYATITDKGRKAQKEIWTYYEAAIQKCFAQHLSESDCEHLVRILSKF